MKNQGTFVDQQLTKIVQADVCIEVIGSKATFEQVRQWIVGFSIYIFGI